MLRANLSQLVAALLILQNLVCLNLVWDQLHENIVQIEPIFAVNLR